MNLGEKVAYLKGLADGLDISSDEKNGKILKGILDVLEEMAAAVDTLEDENETLEDYITEVDEDLGELEKDFDKLVSVVAKKSQKHEYDCFDIDDDDDDEEDDDEYDYDDDDDLESESGDSEVLDGVFELKCPYCKKHILIETDEILKSDSMSVECPECGKSIEIIEESGGCSCESCAMHNHGANDKDEEDLAF